jgi:hypothetical protein
MNIGTAAGIKALKKQGSGGGGGGGSGTYSFVRSATGVAAGTSVATCSIDVTGGNLLVVSEVFYQLNSDAYAADGTNTYNRLNQKTSGAGQIYQELKYVINPTGGTVNITANHNYTIMVAALFSYSGGTAAFDAQAAGNGVVNNTTIQAGSLTPSGTELFIAGFGSSAAFPTPPIDSSFVYSGLVIQEGGNGLWGGLAYKNSSSAENPIWSANSNADLVANLATFK